MPIDLADEGAGEASGRVERGGNRCCCRCCNWVDVDESRCERDLALRPVEDGIVAMRMMLRPSACLAARTAILASPFRTTEKKSTPAPGTALGSSRLRSECKGCHCRACWAGSPPGAALWKQVTVVRH